MSSSRLPPVSDHYDPPVFRALPFCLWILSLLSILPRLISFPSSKTRTVQGESYASARWIYSPQLCQEQHFQLHYGHHHLDDEQAPWMQASQSHTHPGSHFLHQLLPMCVPNLASHLDSGPPGPLRPFPSPINTRPYKVFALNLSYVSPILSLFTTNQLQYLKSKLF